MAADQTAGGRPPTAARGEDAAGDGPSDDVVGSVHDSASPVAPRTLSASLYARGTTDARVREESVFERLRALQREGRLGELSVRTWPEEVSLEMEGESEVVETFRTFESWARSSEVSIRPPFTVRERHSAFTGDEDRLLVTPLVCLALYDADDVVGVYPCNHGESTTTIDDCLARLANDESGVASSDEWVDEPTGRSARPTSRSTESTE